MKSTIAVLFGCGLIQVVISQCRTVPKAEKENPMENTDWVPDEFLSLIKGCFYNEQRIGAGGSFAFADICETCFCSEQSELTCCVDGFEIDPKSLSSDCVAIKDGCGQKAVLRSDLKTTCPSDVFVVGRR
ncbi:uncharacterized protein LOC125662328 [Ostrea edulis]|uniref:uncharacterized protein LOC125662328 n=1 Tax=Ostrea edulis TaxID=37623 RepID=UPI0020940EBF|nr:uncharacterized protein LOC125662328 [Ostrea edulis]